MARLCAKEHNELVATPTILVAENASVRNLIGTVLEKERYAVLLADPVDALEMIRHRPVDLLITNEPWRFEPFLPNLPILYISGAPDREFLQSHRSEMFAYLQKPFRFRGLLEGVHALLCGKRPSRPAADIPG